MTIGCIYCVFLSLYVCVCVCVDVDVYVVVCMCVCVCVLPSQYSLWVCLQLNYFTAVCGVWRNKEASLVYHLPWFKCNRFWQMQS